MESTFGDKNTPLVLRFPESEFNAWNGDIHLLTAFLLKDTTPFDNWAVEVVRNFKFRTQ